MEITKKRLIGYLFVMMSVGCIHAQENKESSQEYKLWYDRPAQVWTEALPLGNGRLGAMVYGTPGIEQIQLNEETIWADVLTTMRTQMPWSISQRCVNLFLPENTSKLKLLRQRK